MPDGWIKIYRKFQEWEWYDKSEMVHLFLHLLLSANVSDKQWHGMKIRRGQLITGRKKLSEETGISEQRIRTCISRLLESGEIETEATNKYTLVTICNYESYQEVQDNINQQRISKEPATSKPQPVKPKKTKEEVLAETNERKGKFYTSLIPFVEKYGKEMVREFYDYWSELNKSGSKMRWEQESTWELEKRLDYWSRRDKSYNKSSKSNGTDNRTNNESAEERATGAANLVARLLSENKPSQ